MAELTRGISTIKNCCLAELVSTHDEVVLREKITNFVLEAFFDVLQHDFPHVR